MKNKNLQHYLDRHFVSRSELEKKLNVSHSELTELICIGFIPSWSYKVESGTSYTHVFGEHPAAGCRDDEYYSTHVEEWYLQNLTHFPNFSIISDIEDQLHSNFIDQYAKEASANTAFKQYYSKIVNDKVALLDMASTTHQHHLKGTYGVCVNEPSLTRIIKKQAAVAALSHITDNGKKSNFTENELAELYKCIAEFNTVAMPFSPVDYEKSSRKRLVDNVLERIQSRA